MDFINNLAYKNHLRLHIIEDWYIDEVNTSHRAYSQVDPCVNSIHAV